MADLQRTLDGRLVPVARHRDDIVVCSDGSECRHEDALYDVADCAHRTDEDRFAANVELVREVLARVEQWSDDYHTGHADYPDGYSYLVDEVSHDWPGIVEQWIRDSMGDGYGETDHDDYMDELVKYLCENLEGSFDCEPEFSGNEYARYYGKGCCLFSLENGECEEQIDIAAEPVLKELHDLGELDDCFDALDRDFCISRSRRRAKNEETGYYEEVGRKTYAPYDHHADHPTVEIYTMPGGQWHFVVPMERMDELVLEYLAERNGSDD